MAIDIVQLVLLCVVAFCAGFVDAIVGGGGLIQTPAALVLLPAHPVVTVIGSLKIPAFSGTSLAALQYLRRVPIRWKLATLLCTVAFFTSFTGSYLLTRVSNSFMKPLLLVVLTAVAIYTFRKKDFGQHEAKDHSPRRELLYAVLISLVLGLYDGFIGPGTGSFLLLAFVTLLGFDFLQSSAHAKLVNLATNLGSITLFLAHGSILWEIALPMAACNALGGAAGARLALAKGNRLIRTFFLIVVTGTLLRFLYDVFLK
ncbi:TSUP family transporter [Paraflavisolibacter sp. H34]|uniref:sulfite exporter TauE/SafE family protein n=1 Tax=Huijunlia imazamoxiresistens TaxID=3127457 RepID=UPI00301B38F4